ncbi:MAG: hypothetical protein IKU11_02495, partial [Clostridia bacterium]|nr:hypothetical protein [Clostridia bacterium]
KITETYTNRWKERKGWVNGGNSLLETNADRTLEYLNKNGVWKKIKFHKIHFTFSKKCDTIIK